MIPKIHLTFFLLIFVLPLTAQVQLSGVVNNYTKVTAIEKNECQTRITVQNTGSFVEENRVVLIQMQGAIIDESNSASFGDITDFGSAGLYEIHEIDFIDGQDVFLSKQLVNDYDVNGNVQLISMPTFDDVEVVDTLTATPWDGNVGGVLALKVDGQLLLNGTIDVSGLGFSGGVTNTAANNNCTWLFQQNDFHYNFGNWRGAAKGEGIAEIINGKEFGKGAQANGGGGGNDHNSGGGGGGNVTNGGVGGENFEPSNFGCQGSHPGVGGKGISNFQNRLFLGGGGGAGHDNNGVGTNGGRGGGIVILQINNLTPNAFSIKANGVTPPDGGGDGGGGGGAGGSILIEAQSVMNTIQLDAIGGNGGLVANPGERCFGPGGGGSGGRVVTNLMTSDPLTVAINGGQPGLTTGSTSCADGNNGAQNGMDGMIENTTLAIVGNEEFLIPNADFDFTINMGEVTFINLSNNDEEVVWDLGDGSTSTVSEPIHTYSQEGVYEVQLIISNVCGTDTVSQMIEIFFPPIASFDFGTSEGCIPFVMDYNNLSTGSINSLNWTFEGGIPASSTDTNPQVIYETAGVFDVQLIADGPGGSDTVLLEDAVEIVEAPVADFDFVIDGSTVTFTNNSNNAMDYIWSFGDGSSASDTINPTHQYDNPGTYEVTLTAFAEYCEVTFTQAIFLDFVDVEDLEKLNIKIYPNPTNHFVFIEKGSESITELKIHTVDGKEISNLTDEFSNDYTLDVSALLSGVYFLTLRQDGEEVKYRLVKM